MQKLIEIVGLFLLSSVKFLFAPSASVAAGYGFVETLIITISGGVFGVFLFFFFRFVDFSKMERLFSK